MIDNLAMLACNFGIFYAVWQLIKIEKVDLEEQKQKDNKHG